MPKRVEEECHLIFLDQTSYLLDGFRRAVLVIVGDEVDFAPGDPSLIVDHLVEKSHLQPAARAVRGGRTAIRVGVANLDFGGRHARRVPCRSPAHCRHCGRKSGDGGGSNGHERKGGSRSCQSYRTPTRHTARCSHYAHSLCGCGKPQPCFHCRVITGDARFEAACGSPVPTADRRPTTRVQLALSARMAPMASKFGKRPLSPNLAVRHSALGRRAPPAIAALPQGDVASRLEMRPGFSGSHPAADIAQYRANQRRA